MSLAEWDQYVAPHLHGIEAGAQMCARHVVQMVYRPGFETIAEFELKKAESILTAALARVREARRMYDDKPVAD
jgi:hypothetical protein